MQTFSVMVATIKSLKEKHRYKYLTSYVAAFIACYLTQSVLLNRLIYLHGLNITGGTFIYFSTPLIMDVVTEVYGYKISRLLLWQGIIAIAFYAICTVIVIHAPAPPYWGHIADAYTTALHSTARGAVVGILAVIIGQFINIYLISKWKILCHGRWFWLRSVGSSVFGDGISTTIAICGIFLGRIPLHGFIRLLLPEFVVMIVFSAIGAVPAQFLVRVTAKAEQVDAYDKGIDFNPFKLSTSDE